MTECHPTQLEFHRLSRREVIGRFDGGQISSDGGGLLLREVELRTGVLSRLARTFTDHRHPDFIEHSVLDLVSQRVYGIALGYEDLNDHDQLRHDHLLALMVGKQDIQGRARRGQDQGKQLASSSTLNRLELSTGNDLDNERYKKIVADTDAMDDLLVDAFMDAYRRAPKEIILDLDATDDPLHGEQEGRFFHGYYRCYCYLPLYIFCDDHLLCARLRPSNQDGAAGSLEEVERIVKRIRCRWPKTRIMVRGDSGFCRDYLMTWCEANEVKFILGVAKNARLKRALDAAMSEAKTRCEETGEPARVFVDLRYQTEKSWSSERRVVGKAEHLPQGENPRFVVTNLDKREIEAQALYEDVYCARGDMENRIKEQQLDLFADRSSTATIQANQLRLYFASFAYVLMSGLRRLGLSGTTMAKAQCGTIRQKWFKIGVRLKVTVRKVWLSDSESYPYAELFDDVLARLQRLPLFHPPP